MDKATLRAALLTSIPRRSKRVTVKLPVGEFEVELRQMTIAERDEVTERSTKNGKLSHTEMAVQYLLACAYVPGTGDLALDAEDADAIRQSPANGHFEKLAADALRLHTEEAVEQGKASAATSGA